MTPATTERSRRHSSPDGRGDVTAAVDRGIAYLTQFQTESGSIRGDYDGPLFLTPGYVFAHYATETPIPEARRGRLVRYLEGAQNEDGGFGLHLEGPSLLFTTVLNHVAMRLLGTESPRALAWIRDQGGAVAIPSWGKYWLAIMRLYDWDGVNPVLPELWLLPRWLPIHPSRFWCHNRVIYLPLSYLCGRRWQIPDDPLIRSIREEIFVEEPDWRDARRRVRPGDVLVPPHRVSRAMNRILAAAKPLTPRRMRERSLAKVVDHVEHEESTTGFVAIGPINKALNAIVLHVAGSSLARSAIEGMPQYLFDGERGLTMSAYQSSQLWDTAFTAQALAAIRRTDAELAAGLRRFIVDNQVRDDVPARRRYYRGPSRGGWTFSTRQQGWPVGDCTGEGLSAALALGGIERQRVVEAVEFLVRLQNPDGGWPTFERRRASPLLERLNPTELFANTMIDHSHVEVTVSVMNSLVLALPTLDGSRASEIRRAVRRGARYIRRNQRPDGSWEGSWGICFTYGTWFGVRGLRAAGGDPENPAMRRAVEFLLSKQLPDGGWGESWESCTRRQYVHHPEGSQPVMTAWACMALQIAGLPDGEHAVRRATRFLLASQLDDGDWPQRGLTGVHNRTSMLNYRFYRNVFPIWALGLAARQADDATHVRGEQSGL